MTTSMKTQILVVDDSQAVRDLLQQLLQGAGYQVHTAADGRQALSMMHTYRIDLAVVDLYLPGLNGYALCTELQKMTVPVIFISAALGAEEKQCAAALGAAVCLRKPFHLTDIETAIHQVLHPA